MQARLAENASGACLLTNPAPSEVLSHTHLPSASKSTQGTCANDFTAYNRVLVCISWLSFDYWHLRPYALYFCILWKKPSDSRIIVELLTRKVLWQWRKFGQLTLYIDTRIITKDLSVNSHAPISSLNSSDELMIDNHFLSKMSKNELYDEWNLLEKTSSSYNFTFIL